MGRHVSAATTDEEAALPEGEERKGSSGETRETDMAHRRAEGGVHPMPEINGRAPAGIPRIRQLPSLGDPACARGRGRGFGREKSRETENRQTDTLEMVCRTRYVAYSSATP